MTEDTPVTSTALVVRPSMALLNPDDILIDKELAMLAKMRLVRDTVLVEGVHYGTMPGVDRPFLQQPGAEVFYRVLNLRPRYSIVDSALDPLNQYCYFLVKAEVVSIDYDVVVGESNGACSSFEYDENCRDVYVASNPDTTTVNCPSHGTQRARKFKAQNQWKAGCPVKTPAPLARTIQNVQSKAQKRAMVAAIRTVGCISEMFTQDEDLVPKLRAGGGDEDNSEADKGSGSPRPRSNSGQGVRRTGTGQARTPGQVAPKANPPRVAAPKQGQPTAGAEAELTPAFKAEMKKGFALIKEAGVSGPELRGWAEDRGLIQPGEELTARIGFRFASQLSPLPQSDEDAVAAFATAVLEVLKSDPEPESDVDLGEPQPVDGEFTEEPIDGEPFE